MCLIRENLQIAVATVDGIVVVDHHEKEAPRNLELVVVDDFLQLQTETLDAQAIVAHVLELLVPLLRSEIVIDHFGIELHYVTVESLKFGRRVLI